MKPGIKPTHLWHWTCRKFYERILNDRLSIKGIHHRNARELMQTTIIVLAFGVSLMYAFGEFRPEEMITKFLREHSCNELAQNLPKQPKKEPDTKKLDPCPPKKK